MIAGIQPTSEFSKILSRRGDSTSEFQTSKHLGNPENSIEADVVVKRSEGGEHVSQYLRALLGD